MTKSSATKKHIKPQGKKPLEEHRQSIRRQTRTSISDKSIFVSHSRSDGKKLLEELRQSITEQTQTPLSQKSVFISHGLDVIANRSVKDFVAQLGLKPILLHEQPNVGKTITEKFESFSDADFAIVLLTPEEVEKSGQTYKGRKLGEDRQMEYEKLKPMARQNIIFELGYLIGRLGRNRTIALYKEGIDIPSDYQGINYIQMDSAGAWKMQLASRIKNAGIDVDLNKVL